MTPEKYIFGAGNMSQSIFELNEPTEQIFFNLFPAELFHL